MGDLIISLTDTYKVTIPQMLIWYTCNLKRQTGQQREPTFEITDNIHLTVTKVESADRP